MEDANIQYSGDSSNHAVLRQRRLNTIHRRTVRESNMADLMHQRQQVLRLCNESPIDHVICILFKSGRVENKSCASRVGLEVGALWIGPNGYSFGERLREESEGCPL